MPLWQRLILLVAGSSPYVHSRLAQIEHTENDNKRIDVQVTMTLEPSEDEFEENQQDDPPELSDE
jgi:hypothetical protein